MHRASAQNLPIYASNKMNHFYIFPGIIKETELIVFLLAKYFDSFQL